MKIEIVPCLTDNYAYILTCTKSGKRALVDAPEHDPVERALGGRTLDAVWATHHHLDHVGANESIRARFRCDVFGFGPDRERVPALTRALEDGERFRLGELNVTILHVPGHTLGAIAYFVESPSGERAVFTGDTLFLAGCGRLFEGTPAQMHTSLGRLAALPGETRVYCGHEYTASNLRFAAAMEPSNAAVAARIARTTTTRDAGQPTMGAPLAEELETNPFLRVRSSEIRASVGFDSSTPNDVVFGAIRKRKDTF